MGAISFENEFKWHLLLVFPVWHKNTKINNVIHCDIEDYILKKYFAIILLYFKFFRLWYWKFLFGSSVVKNNAAMCPPKILFITVSVNK